MGHKGVGVVRGVPVASYTQSSEALPNEAPCEEKSLESMCMVLRSGCTGRQMQIQKNPRIKMNLPRRTGKATW